MDITIPMRPSNFFDETIRLRDVLAFENDDFDLYATAITMANYKATSILDIVQKQLHLSLQNRDQLFSVLNRHSRLFDGVLKVYPHRLIHLDLLQNAIPTHQRAYSVAHVHLEVFKNELSRLCKVGVLERCRASQWASPTLIIPKKDGSVRWVSDFQELNKVIQRHKYPSP